MTAVRSFLPWYRAGLATALAGAPPAGAARAAVPATVQLRGETALSPLTVPAQLAGPGDVIGIDRQEVLRAEPFDGSIDFEPSYFPYVELAAPDLPWRFTPLGPEERPLPDPEDDQAEPHEQQWLRPWIALATVPVDAATLTPAAAEGGVPTLRCDAAELPYAAEAWAWAHVQVTHDSGQSVQSAVEEPGRRVARLICPRRLAAGVRYVACVVPTFAAAVPGRAGDPLGPAWDAAGPVELPVYFSWSFATGEEGSFEALVRRLRPRPMPAGFGGRRIATGAPGWRATASSPDAEVVMQGALRPLGVPEPPPGDATLAESLRTAVSRSGEGIELRPPIYGQDYQDGIAALDPGATGWLAQLNTDPRRRAAAGLAAWAVAVDQEELADAAWQQLARARPQASGAGDAGLAGAVAGSLAERHQVADVAPEQVAPAARFAPRFDESAYARLRAVAEEWLLPAADELPNDSVVLLQTNAAFVESFLIGLNHALARELTWRRYPLDTAATFFDRFWAPAAGAQPAAIDPIASWSAQDGLGSHTPGADQLVLLLRGALLRRFPTTAVYLSRTNAAGAAERLLPHLSGTIGEDVVFIGFPLTAAQAIDAGAPWSVVVQEPVGQARFGYDDPATGSPTPLGSWQDLDWGHPQLQGRTHAPVAGPLAGVARPVAAGSPQRAVWALDAASVALASQQPAFRVRFPVRLWIEPLIGEGTPT